MRKILLLLLALGAATRVSAAWDPLMPADAGSLELRPGYGYISEGAIYDINGNAVDTTTSGAKIAGAYQDISLGLRYGLLPGLDVEADADYQILNAYFDNFKLSKTPIVALRYIDPEFGLGGFASVGFPLGNVDTINFITPHWFFEGGLLYGKLFGNLGIAASASYLHNLEDPFHLIARDELRLLVRPRYFFNRGWSAFLGVQFTDYTESKIDGTGNGDGGNLTSATPGLRFTAPHAAAFELSVPVSLLGKNNYAFVGVQVSAFLAFRPD